MENKSEANRMMPSSSEQDPTNSLLQTLQQIRQLRENGLLSSVQTQNEEMGYGNLQSSVSPLDMLTNLASRYSTLQARSALLGSNTGTLSSPLQWNPETSLPVTTWTSGEDVYLLGCVPKCLLSNLATTSGSSGSLPQLPVLNTFKNQIEATTPISSNSSGSRKRAAPYSSFNGDARPAARKQRKVLQSSKQKRTKWTSTDLSILWQSISVHGNEWQKVKTSLSGRTYHQVKDKGKRLLHEKGWQTGRSKVQNDLACERAKIIAHNVLATLKRDE